MRYYFLLLFFFQNIVAQSQTWPHQNSIDSLLNTKHYQPDMPGISFCIVSQGKIVYERQFGMANVQKKLPITTETMFNIGSVTKQFTATCILLLEEQGKVDLNAPIQQYLPELPDFGAKITLHHLIAHTSGIPDHLEVMGLQNNFSNKRLQFDRMVAYLRQAPSLSFAPGTDFAYCNTGYMLLAMIVERASGMSIADFAQKNIFSPLGMQHSNFALTENEGLPDATTSYDFNAAKGRYKHDKPGHNAMGATGIHATVRDFVLWDQNFRHNVLGKKGQGLISKMETSYRLNDASSVHYGAGLILKPYKGHPCVEHSGGWSSFLMQYRQLPDQDLSVIVISNNDHASPFLVCDQICDLLLPTKHSLMDFKASLAGLKMPINDVLGTYMDANNVIRKLVFQNDSLKVTSFSNPSKALVCLAFEKVMGDSMVIFKDNQGDLLRIRKGKNGQVLGFFWEGAHYFRFNRFYQKLDDGTAFSPQHCAGKYRSLERKQRLKVKYNKRTGRLKVFPVFFKGFSLEHIAGNVYRVKGEVIYLRFSENGVSIGNEWVFNLRLDKKG